MNPGMNPAHSTYWKHRTRGYILRVYPATDNRCVHRALRFPKKTAPYFVTVTAQQLVNDFQRIKAIEVPEKLRP